VLLLNDFSSYLGITLGFIFIYIKNVFDEILTLKKMGKFEDPPKGAPRPTG